jgi:uncharacterized protein
MDSFWIPKHRSKESFEFKHDMSNSDSIHYISERTAISRTQIQNTLRLLEAGASIPFIARYRKEITGGLLEQELFQISQTLRNHEELIARKEYILKTLAESGVLHPDLEKKLLNCQEIQMLEDLYAPYKQKKKTKADLARESGLEPLALKILSHYIFPLKQEAGKLICEKFPDVSSVLEGTRHIISDQIHKNDELRARLRKMMYRNGTLTARLVKSKEQEAAKYRDYFNYQESLHKVMPHRYLAICRAENEKMLRVSIDTDHSPLLDQIRYKYSYRHSAELSQQVAMAIEDALERLILPLLEAQIRQELKEQADKSSIEVFGRNLRQALLEPPLGQKSILAIDPGFRTGCKCVILDESGSLMDHFTIYPVEPKNATVESERILRHKLELYQIKSFAIGDGTAGKELLSWLESWTGPFEAEIFSVDESGASVYSASELARKEFPDLDIVFRGAVSIGRRLQDPLAELIKIDPKSIGLGQYQHDVNQKWLQDRLDFEVSSCVHQVGVQLNTASPELLGYISGIGPALAQAIVRYRAENGFFKSKNELMNVPRLGAKAFEQCAGFVRIRDGKHPLDNTGVHPERYNLVEKIARSLKLDTESLVRNPAVLDQIKLTEFVSEDCSLESLKDILSEIKRPGLDPRGQLEAFHFDHRIKSIQDLQIGMELPAIIKNITQFGAFADIGIKESGLIHVSEIRQEFVRDAGSILKLKQKVKVRVIGLDPGLGRIQLSMKAVGS